MTKKASTPALRFKGFTYTWKQRKLSDQFSDFIVPMRDKPKKFGGNIPWTRIEDIEGKYLNGSLSGQFVSKDTIKQMNLKIIPKDSLIVSSSATFGVVAIITQDLITNQTFIGLVPNDKETLDFWYTFFHSNEARNYMRLQSAGSTIFYIAREHFEKMPIIIPFKDEMITIGKYFSNLDRLITLHQRKYDKLTNMKKSMLEKMFPNNGANVPEIRFKGFTDAWEQRKLKELATFAKGTGYSKSDLTEQGTPIILYGRLYTKYDTKINDVDTFAIAKKSSVYSTGNEVIVPASGETAEDIARASYVAKSGFLLGGDLNIIYPIDRIEPTFLALSISNGEQQKSLAQKAQGKSVVHIHNSDLESIKISYPKMEEQEKIGRYFLNLDRLITLHQRELEKLKNLKKACLEKMFV